MAQRSVYEIYGLRVQDDADWLALEEDPGQCRNDGSVGYIQAGAYNRDMVFLALRWREVEPGEYTYHSGEQPNANRATRTRWNRDLRAVADRLNLTVLEGPGWFTIPDEG